MQRRLLAPSVILILLLAVSAPADAKTFTVTSGAGCGPSGTLEAAINAANASPGADTVDFSEAVRGTGIGLGSCPDRSSRGNRYAMFASDDLTIRGPVAIQGFLAWLDQSGNMGRDVMSPANAHLIAANTGFLQVGAYGDTAKPVHVTLDRVDVLPVGVAPGSPSYWSMPVYALVNANSSLTVDHGRIEGIIDATSGSRSSIPPITLEKHAALTLRDSYLDHNAYFGDAGTGLDAVISASRGSHVVIDRSVVVNTRPDMAAVSSLGGDVKIVSSVFTNGGGVSLSSGATGSIVNTAISSPHIGTGPTASVVQQGLVVDDSTATVQASTIAVEPQLSSGCGIAVTGDLASAIYQRGDASALTIRDSIVGGGNPTNFKAATLPIWQRRGGAVTASSTWTNADQYGPSAGSDCTFFNPNLTTQAPLPAGVSSGPLGLWPNAVQYDYPYQGLPAFGPGSKIIGLLSGPVLSPLDGQPIAFDAYATYLRVLNDFRIDGKAWPGADTHRRVSPGGLRDLGAMEQLQFQSILTAIAVSGKARLQWTEAGQAPGPITAHEVQYRPKGSATWLAGPPASGADTGVNVLGLQNGRTYEFRVRAVAGASGPGPWSNVAEALPPVPQVATIAYPDGAGVAGRPITPLRVHVSGLVGPVRWNAPTLPYGLTISRSTGTISGTSAGPGTFSVTVTATDALGTQALTVVTIVIAPSGTILPAILSYADMVGTVGVPIDVGYAHPTGLPGALRYRATGLPVGLRIDPQTGAITGAPARAGTFFPVVTATAGTMTVRANRFVISVLVPEVPAHIAYPVIRGRVGRPLGDVFPQLAGIVHTTTFIPSRMPRGLTMLPSAGVVRGTPRTAGTFTVVVAVYHGFDLVQTVATIRITAVAAGRHLSYPTGRVLQGRPIHPVLPHVTGVTGPRRYRASGLPRGLHLSARTGAITGRAQTAGGSTAKVTVTGANGSASATVTLHVTYDPAYRPPAPRSTPHFTG